MKKNLCAFLLAMILTFSLIPSTAFASSSDDSGYAASMSEAAKQLRSEIKKRHTSITVKFISNAGRISTPAAKTFQEAIKHTGVPTEGDYIKFQYAGWNAEIYPAVDGNKVYYTIYYNMRYYTTASQEKTTDEKIQSIINSLHVSGASDYQKVRAIYDYICSHVDYDYTNLPYDSYTLKDTCYAAAVNKKAVCQGYALMFYRLALECGLDCRIVAGTGRNKSHAWNIVKVDGKYYNVDATWDADRSPYAYFLKGKNFPDHYREAGSEYASEAFNSKYPISSTDYSPSKVLNKLPVPSVTISTNTSSGYPTLKWNAISGAAKYEVYRATSKTGTYKLMYTTSGTSYTNTSAVAGNNYYYKVRTVNSSGNPGTFSNIAAITCDCAQPTVTVSCNTSTGKPKLHWDAVKGATKYNIYRSTDNGKTYKYYDSTTGTTYTNNSTTPGCTYGYKVRAITSKSSYADSVLSAAKTVVCDCARPEVSLNCDTVSGRPRLSWNAVTGATQYRIYRSTDGGKTYQTYDTTTRTSYLNSSTAPGRTYYYKVRAITSKSSYADSAASAVKYITCDCARPIIKTIGLSNGKPRIIWDAVDGAGKYCVYRSTDGGKTYSAYFTTAGTSYTNTSAKKGCTYYYKVRSISSRTSYADSALSSAVSIRATK